MTREQFMDKLNELAVTYDAHGEPSDSPPTIDEAITWAAFTEARTVTLALLRHATVGPGFGRHGIKQSWRILRRVPIKSMLGHLVEMRLENMCGRCAGSRRAYLKGGKGGRSE